MNRPPQKFYIASSLDNAEQVRQVKRSLEAAGWTHTYDWTTHGSVAGRGAEAFVECATAEAEGVLVADVVVVLLPGGRGTHVELGMALGQLQLATLLKEALPELGIEMSRTICIYSPNAEVDFGTDRRTCALYHHPNVQRFDDLDEMVGWLLSE